MQMAQLEEGWARAGAVLLLIVAAALGWGEVFAGVGGVDGFQARPPRKMRRSF